MSAIKPQKKAPAVKPTEKAVKILPSSVSGMAVVSARALKGEYGS